MKYLKDKVYATLRQKIIDCEYPPESVLTETKLMEDTGVSRTPIREAVNRLSQENLVIVIPKKGILVNGITIGDIIQVFETRDIIEPQILLRYGDRLDKKKISKFAQNCEVAASVEEKIVLDESFHRMIYDVCANKYLREVLNMVEGHNHRNRVWRSNETRVNSSQHEHIEIAKAILADDYSLAAKLLSQHIMNAKEYAIRKYL